MSADFYKPGSDGGVPLHLLQVRLSDGDKELLRQLTFQRRQPASVVIRDLIRQASTPSEAA